MGLDPNDELYSICTTTCSLTKSTYVNLEVNRNRYTLLDDKYFVGAPLGHIHYSALTRKIVHFTRKSLGPLLLYPGLFKFLVFVYRVA